MAVNQKVEVVKGVDAKQGQDRIELLRKILEKQQGYATYEEAREVGDALIEFYQILAEDTDDDPE